MPRMRIRLRWSIGRGSTCRIRRLIGLKHALLLPGCSWWPVRTSDPGQELVDCPRHERTCRQPYNGLGQAFEQGHCCCVACHVSDELTPPARSDREPALSSGPTALVE